MLGELISRKISPAVRPDWCPRPGSLGAGLVGSEVMVVALLRYVVCLEPLASLRRDKLADIVAPTPKRYLVGGLSR